MADADDVLLSDSDETPDLDPPSAAPAARKRGRPKGSTKAATLATGKPERLAGVAEMSRLLSKLLGGASVLLAFALVGPQDAEVVALTAVEAANIAQPAARMLSHSRWARQAAALAAKGSDGVDLTLAVGAYLMRVYPIIALHQAQRAQAQAEKGATASVHMGSAQSIRGGPGAASASAGAQTPAASHASHGGAGDGGPVPSAPIVPFAGLTDSDANQFAAWSNGNLGAALRAAAGN